VNFIQTIKSILLVSVIALFAGCASTPYVSSYYVATGGVADLGNGREAAVVELCKRDPKDTTPAEEIRKNPSQAKCLERSLQFALGTTVGRDLLTGVTPAVLAAATQGEYGLKAIDKQAKVCEGGKCGGGGAQAAAGANSSTNVTVNLGCAATNSCAAVGN
jgi:hypothetical protein